MKLYQVDAFTGNQFRGNPAAVFVLQEQLPDEILQDLAMEMNLSETAFVEVGPKSISLRWFTPQVEVNLCGHATLATAHVLWESGMFNPDQAIEFQTKSGVLTTFKEGSLIRMNFPLIKTEAIPVDPVYNLIFRTQLVAAAKVPGDMVLEIPTADHLKRVAPEVSEISKYSDQGIIITARGKGKYDFYSRYFAPNIGIDEDPATGYAHCVLGDYWNRKLGQNRFTAWQASKRGGEVHVEVVEDRVILGGKAVTVFETQMAL